MALLRAWIEHIVVRLLDPRRLSQLGHRLRLQALACRAARGRSPSRACSRSRPRRGSTTHRARARGRSTCSTAGSSCTSGSRSRPPTARASPRRTSTTSTSRRSARASARCSPRACRPTPRGPSRSGLAEQPGGAAADVLVRRRHRAPRDHHAGLQHRRARREPARLPVRGHRAGPALRRRSARGRERRRPAARRASASWSATPPRRRSCSRSERATSCPRRRRSQLLVVPTRTSSEGEAVPAPSVRRDVRDDRRARPFAFLGGGRRDVHRFSGRTSRRAGRSPGAAAAGYTVDVLFPSWGKRARIEAVLRDGRRVTLAEKGVRPRRVRFATSRTSTWRGRRAGTSSSR